MNWIQPHDLYNKLNLCYGRTPALSRPNYMMLLDVRSKSDYFAGHLPTALRVVKLPDDTWQVTGGFSDVTDKEMLVVYDMSSRNSGGEVSPSGVLVELASHVWQLLSASSNQSNVFLLDDGFDGFTELYPNCKAYQATYTVGELAKLQVLPLHIRMFEEGRGKLYYSPPDSFAGDRVAHVLSDIDAHVNCSVIWDPAFGLSADEKFRVHYCIIENDPNISEEGRLANLREIYNVCLYIDSHLREERNVLVFGEKGNTTAFTVMLAYLIFHEFVDLEEALQRVTRMYPFTVMDETSRACLEVFQERLRNDPDFQTGIPFLIEHPTPEIEPVPDNIPAVTQAPQNALETPEPVSIVGTFMKEILNDLDKQKRQKSSGLNTEAAEQIIADITETAEQELVEEGLFDEDAKKKSTQSDPLDSTWSASKELAVTRLEIWRLEEEAQWKMMHHDRVVPDVHEVAPILTFNHHERLAEALRRRSTRLANRLEESSLDGPSVVGTKNVNKRETSARRHSSEFIAVYRANSDN